METYILIDNGKILGVYEDINNALIQKARQGGKTETHEVDDTYAMIDSRKGGELFVNDDKGDPLHAFYTHFIGDDVTRGDEVVGRCVEIDYIDIYGKLVSKIPFTEDFKRDIDSNAEDALEEINEIN